MSAKVSLIGVILSFSPIGLFSAAKFEWFGLDNFHFHVDFGEAAMATGFTLIVSYLALDYFARRYEFLSRPDNRRWARRE